HKSLDFPWNMGNSVLRYIDPLAGDSMATLYKKPITVIDHKTGEKVKSRSKKWWGRYRDENGQDRRVSLASDKTAAAAELNELVRKVAFRIAGLENPFEKHLKRPLAEHLADFRAFLEGKGNTAKHARQTCTRVRAIIEGCKFLRIGSI